MTETAPTTQIMIRLTDLVQRITNGRITAGLEDRGPDSIRRLGFDSLATLQFLVSVEDEFGIEWSDDVPKEVLTSFDAMAAHITKELGLDG